MGGPAPGLLESLLRLGCMSAVATCCWGICFCPGQQSLSPKGVAARDKLNELITRNVTSFPEQFPLRPLGWVDSSGWTAMHYAAAVGNIAAAKWLRARYAPLVSPMDRRWSEEEQPRLENLCPKAATLSEMKNEYAWQPLHVAAGVRSLADNPGAALHWIRSQLSTKLSSLST